MRNYEGTLKDLVTRMEIKQKEIGMIEQKMDSDSKRFSDLNELEIRMKDLYKEEMKNYSQNINMHIHKDLLVCSVCH